MEMRLRRRTLAQQAAIGAGADGVLA